MDTAQKLFYEKGYEGTSVQDILDDLNSSKGSFYHHFESKASVLDAICLQRAEKAASLAREKIDPTKPGIRQMATVLYYALPIRSGEEDFLSLLLPIAAKEEGKTLAVQYGDALTRAFSPLLDAALDTARKDGSLFIYYPDAMPSILLRMLNDCWQQAVQLEMGNRGGSRSLDADGLIQLLDAYRFSLERLTDAPFGSLEILSLQEWLQVFRVVKERITLMPEKPQGQYGLREEEGNLAETQS